MTTRLRILLLVAASWLAACASKGPPTAGGPSVNAADASHRSDAQARVDDAGTPVEDPGPPCVDPPDGGLPSDVFCTGLYKNRNSAKYMPDAVPYTPGVPFWSDGAQKQRYLYLPKDSKIDTSNMDIWKFPV